MPVRYSVHSYVVKDLSNGGIAPRRHHSSESSKLLECQWWSFVTLWPFTAKYHPRLIDWKVILLVPSQTKHSGLFAHFLIHSLLLGRSISFQVPELLTPYNFHWLMLFSHLAFSLFSNYVNSFFHPLSAWPCMGWLLSALIGGVMSCWRKPFLPRAWILNRMGRCEGRISVERVLRKGKEPFPFR